MKRLVIVFLVMIAILACSGCGRNSEKIIGIKIYEYSKDFNLLADKWKEMGINTAFVSKELAANSPMCYSQMLRRDAEWITSVVTDMDKKAPGKILPSIQVYPYYIDDPFTAEDFKECVDEALKAPSKGIVFFSWPLFEKDPVRMEINRYK